MTSLIQRLIASVFFRNAPLAIDLIEQIVGGISHNRPNTVGIYTIETISLEYDERHICVCTSGIRIEFLVIMGDEYDNDNNDELTVILNGKNLFTLNV